MPKRLYLHIGHSKAASSTIQGALTRNVDAFRDAGYLVADGAFEFPESGPLNGAPTMYVGEKFEMAEEGLSEALTRFHALSERVGNRVDKFIVSAESLSLPGAESLARGLRHVYEIHLIYYLRRQDDWLVSAWNQWGIKAGLGLAEFVERELAAPRPNYAKVIECWEPLVDTLHVRPLHTDALVGGDVVTDFVSAVGADIEMTPSTTVNPSLDVALLEVLASSEFVFDSIHDQSITNWIRASLPPNYPVERAALGPKMLEKVRATFANQNQQLHRRFFSHVDYDAVFGPRPSDEPNEAASELDRTRRVIGLQLKLLFDLEQRIGRLEKRGDS